MFDTKTLCEKACISQATFYRLIRENKSLRVLTENNATKKGKRKYYSDTVLQWLLKHNDSPLDTPTSETPVSEHTQQQIPPQHPNREELLLEQVAILKAEVERLTNALASKETESNALIYQVTTLTALLNQEKQEKLALLPAPKTTLKQRIKALFKKAGGE